jgi:hypothetical protein
MLHVGDTTTIEITLYDEGKRLVNLTDAKECLLYIQRGQDILKRTCSIKSPPESGVITYQLTPDDLTLENIDYVFQPVILFNNGNHFNGTAIIERVYPTLEQKLGDN